jgi:hypothetical protein
VLEIILAAPNGHVDEVENTSFYSLSYLLAREQRLLNQTAEPDKPLTNRRIISTIWERSVAFYNDH